MELNEAYFFDTYAIIELINKNPAYAKYLNTRMATSSLNLIETHYNLLRKKGPAFAEAFLDSLRPAVIPLDEAIVQGNLLRHHWKQRKVSFADCIGYVLAGMAGLKFLTGDKEFEGLPNVEFVK